MKLTTNQRDMISASTFLVTGGAGFIGSHIAEFLLDAGARKVRVLDNLSTGHFRNMAPFANHPAFEFTNGDIRNVDTCKSACQGMDYVFHLAALTSDAMAQKDPVIASSMNTSGFLNMLIVAQAAKVKRFVYASRSSVYENDDLHGTEKITDINELYAYQYARLYGMETIGLRYCNVFGKRHHAQSAYAASIPAFVMQLRRHESPVIDEADDYGCCFTYIENVVQANMLAVLTTNAQAVNQVYNITYDEKTTLHQLARCLKEYLSVFDERIGDIDLVNERAGEEVIQPVSFIEKAKQLLGYQPHCSLRDGLLQTAGWYWAYLPQYEEEVKEKKLHELEFAV